MTAWTEHLKEYAAKNNMTYKEAMKDEKSKTLYNKTKPATPPKEKKAPKEKVVKAPKEKKPLKEKKVTKNKKTGYEAPPGKVGGMSHTQREKKSKEPPVVDDDDEEEN
tara:strand:- start:3532 stop:3855 length:324 start_codon:yes stop_codon:yes gene_type:complete